MPCTEPSGPDAPADRTIDKLESVPGVNPGQSIERFKEIVRKIGVCVIGQTGNLVPADKKMYALRDVTGTVESIPLISGSIMSKKLAEGIDALATGFGDPAPWIERAHAAGIIPARVASLFVARADAA